MSAAVEAAPAAMEVDAAPRDQAQQQQQAPAAAGAAAGAAAAGGGGGKGGGGGGYELPWVEKYRPQLVRDVVGNRDAVERLKVVAEDGNMPNLILSGPPGTGKTTSILAVARQLLGPHFKDAVLELNASDDRGIDVVRNKIKMFAQKKVTLPPGRHKVVVLDEADSMTAGAQQALRRTMELYSNTTRFALACNTSTKVIEPIQSRCAIVRFTKVPNEDVLARLQYVVQKEGVTCTDAGLEAVLFTADGDMRQALNNLQATVTGFGDVTDEAVFKVCDQPHPALVRDVLLACARGDLAEAHRGMRALCDLGYAASDIIATVFRVARAADLNEFLKLEFLREIGFCHVRITDGVASRLQLDGLLAKLCKQALASGGGGGGGGK